MVLPERLLTTWNLFSILSTISKNRKSQFWFIIKIFMRYHRHCAVKWSYYQMHGASRAILFLSKFVLMFLSSTYNAKYMNSIFDFLKIPWKMHKYVTEHLGWILFRVHWTCFYTETAKRIGSFEDLNAAKLLRKTKSWLLNVLSQSSKLTRQRDCPQIWWGWFSYFLRH